jgi:hypothetical protein
MSGRSSVTNGFSKRVVCGVVSPCRSQAKESMKSKRAPRKPTRSSGRDMEDCHDEADRSSRSRIVFGDLTEKSEECRIAESEVAGS